jgi:hypothetical protein
MSRRGTEAALAPDGLEQNGKPNLNAGMNRLSPLIVRRTGRFAPALAWPESRLPSAEQAAAWIEDLKLFTTFWLGGLVFFGAFFA